MQRRAIVEMGLVISGEISTFDLDATRHALLQILPPADGLLRIGMKFNLTCVGGDGNRQFLQSQRYTLHNQNFATSVGMRKQGCCAAPAESIDTLWEVAALVQSPAGQAFMQAPPRAPVDGVPVAFSVQNGPLGLSHAYSFAACPSPAAIEAAIPDAIRVRVRVRHRLGLAFTLTP